MLLCVAALEYNRESLSETADLLNFDELSSVEHVRLSFRLFDEELVFL